MEAKVPNMRLEFEKAQCDLLVRLKENIEGNYINQVANITRQMRKLAIDTHVKNPECLRGLAPMRWLELFVNGELK